MVVAGYLLWRHTPKNINCFYGYRTSRSMKNADTWNFANKHCGKLWLVIGSILLPISTFVHIPFFKSPDDVVGILCIILLTIQLFVMLLTIPFTEKALRNRYHEDGTIK